MDDEIDRGLQGPGDGEIAHESILSLDPIFDAVGQPLIVDNDQKM